MADPDSPHQISNPALVAGPHHLSGLMKKADPSMQISSDFPLPMVTNAKEEQWKGASEPTYLSAGVAPYFPQMV